jgi:hypothetical protein
MRFLIQVVPFYSLLLQLILTLYIRNRKQRGVAKSWVQDCCHFPNLGGKLLVQEEITRKYILHFYLHRKMQVIGCKGNP